MRLSLKSLACVAFAVVLGCSSQSSTKPVVADVQSSQATGELVPHPEFANWSQFPVGTTVVRRDQLASENGDLFQVTTVRLAAKSAEEVSVEHQTTIERGAEKKVGETISFDYQPNLIFHRACNWNSSMHRR